MQAWNQWSNQATAAAAAAGFAAAGYPSTTAPPAAAATAPQTAYPIGYQYYGAGPGMASATPVSWLL
jgi:hypothetical protein